MLKRILHISIFLLWNLITLGYVNVTPLYFDKRIDGEGSEQIYTLVNSTNNILRYRVYSEKNSNSMGNDMSSWIEIYPKSLTLNPGEIKDVKIQIIAPKQTKQGEYLANLGIKEVGIPDKISSTSITIFTDLKIEIAGFVGNLKPKLSFDNLEIKYKENNLLLSGNLVNIGEIRTRAELYLVDGDNNMKFIGKLRLFKGESKSLDDLNLKKISLKEANNFLYLQAIDMDGEVLLKESIKISGGLKNEVN